jgi:hypothetical protein
MKHAKPLPDQVTLKRLFDYDQQSGILTWLERLPSDFQSERSAHACSVWNAKYAGKSAGSVQSNGYIVTSIYGTNCRVHRVIWKWMTGSDAEFVDHIDCDRSNNRWANLRSVSKAENARNCKIRRDNISGYPGVGYLQSRGLYYAEIGLGLSRHSMTLGYFSTIQEAIAARKAAEILLDYRRDHAKHNM